MKKFNFNLEAVLKLRKHKEMQAQLGFAKVQQEKTRLELEIQTAHERIQSYHSEDRNGPKQASAFQLSQNHGFIAQEFRTVFRNEQALKNLQPMVDTKRRELIEANKATSMLEKLREKKAEEYLEDQKQQETAAMDEMATMVFNLQQKERNRLK